MLRDEMIKPSRRSLLALDALYFVLSDVRGGLKPFLAVYLAAAHHWDPARIGIAMGVMGIAELAAQTPCGALTDAARDKRVVIVLAFLLVGAGSLAMVVWPTASVILVIAGDHRRGRVGVRPGAGRGEPGAGGP